MDITYFGHSAFRLKGKAGVVVTDPYDDYVGFSLPPLTADIVTVSHAHADHNASAKVKPSSRRDKCFIIDQPGEYDVAGISVFGVSSFHDESMGTERGINTIFTILIDDIRVCHLGDLGHELTSDQLTEIGAIDILLCPVGGGLTIDPTVATKTIHQLEPSIVIPMHYRTDQHNQDVFADVGSLADFLKVYGSEVPATEKLVIDKGQLAEETSLVVLSYGIA